MTSATVTVYMPLILQINDILKKEGYSIARAYCRNIDSVSGYYEVSKLGEEIGYGNDYYDQKHFGIIQNDMVTKERSLSSLFLIEKTRRNILGSMFIQRKGDHYLLHIYGEGNLACGQKLAEIISRELCINISVDLSDRSLVWESSYLIKRNFLTLILRFLS